MNLLFYLGLLPALIMLGGFKFAIKMLMSDVEVSELNLTLIGIAGAFVSCFARLLFIWMSEM